MSVFNVELKKVVDDSYEIEIGYHLEDKLIEDIEHGLVGNIRKFAVITDSNVSELYARPIGEKLMSAGYNVDMFVFPAGEESKNGTNYLTLVNTLAQYQLTRTDLIVALGGGVVGGRYCHSFDRAPLGVHSSDALDLDLFYVAADTGRV